MKLITLYLPIPYIQDLDRLVNEKYYPNRAEAIRVAVRDLLLTEAWNPKRKTLHTTNSDFHALPQVEQRETTE